MKKNVEALSWMIPTVLVAILMVGAGSVTVNAATLGVAITEELETVREKVSITQTSDGIVVGFGDVTYNIPQPASGTLQATLTASGGAFVGDYVDAGVAGMTFNMRLQGDADASVNIEILAAQSGRVWRMRGINDLANGSEWLAANISLDRRAGWEWSSHPDYDTDERFLEDLADVESLSITINRGDVVEHTCTVNSLKLLLANQVATPAAVLEATLSEYFGGKTSVAQLSESEKLLDSDGDGQMDYEEILYTLTDHLDASSSMGLTELKKGANGPILQWSCVMNGVYDVLRANAVTGPYDTVVAEGLVGPENGSMSTEDTSASGSGPFFYKVLKTN